VLYYCDGFQFVLSNSTNRTNWSHRLGFGILGQYIRGLVDPSGSELGFRYTNQSVLVRTIRPTHTEMSLPAFILSECFTEEVHGVAPN
jgi:hypothetical protein